MGYGKIKMKKGGEKKVDMNSVKKDANKFMKMMKYKYGNFKMSYKVGGMKEVDAEKNPGLAKLPTEVRNKMGYKKKGGMKMMGGTKEKMMMKGGKKKMMMGGTKKKMGGGYKMKK